jgi:hypothetical protein
MVDDRARRDRVVVLLALRCWDKRASAVSLGCAGLGLVDLALRAASSEATLDVPYGAAYRNSSCDNGILCADVVRVYCLVCTGIRAVITDRREMAARSVQASAS